MIYIITDANLYWLIANFGNVYRNEANLESLIKEATLTIPLGIEYRRAKDLFGQFDFGHRLYYLDNFGGRRNHTFPEWTYWVLVALF